MVPCGSQRARKFCSLLLLVGSVFVGFLFWENTYNKIFLACYSDVWFSFCYVWSGNRAVIVASVCIVAATLCSAPLVCWVLGALPSLCHLALAPLLPVIIVPISREENRQDPVCLSVCLTWKQRLHHGTCLSVLVCGECFMQGRWERWSLLQAVKPWSQMARDIPVLSVHCALERCQGLCPSLPVSAAVSGNTGGSDSGQVIPGLNWQEVDLNTRVAVYYTLLKR